MIGIALAKLPGDVKEACKKLWADVAALLKRVSEKPPEIEAEKR
jgi:hypothetical protein